MNEMRPTGFSSPKSPRKLGSKAWVPDQPSAWVMALLPPLAGMVAAGLSWDALWLLTAWALCYCVQYVSARWVSSRLNRRYLPPVLAYGAVLAVVGLPFLVVHWRIVMWAPWYLVLFGASLIAAYRHCERSLVNNVVAIISSCTMSGLVYGYDANPGDDAWPYMELRAVYLAAAFALFQFGSVLVVKTMIRERGNPRYRVASVLWHAMMLVVCTVMLFHARQVSNEALCALWFLWIVCLLLLVRACVLPLIDARHGSRLKPVVTGMVEFAASVLSAVAILVVF